MFSVDWKVFQMNSWIQMPFSIPEFPFGLLDLLHRIRNSAMPWICSPMVTPRVLSASNSSHITLFLGTGWLVIWKIFSKCAFPSTKNFPSYYASERVSLYLLFYPNNVLMWIVIQFFPCVFHKYLFYSWHKYRDGILSSFIYPRLNWRLPLLTIISSLQEAFFCLYTNFNFLCSTFIL